QLQLNGAVNADLTLILRIYFQRVDPTPLGGRQMSARDGNGKEYKLEPINEGEFQRFCEDACQQASKAWSKQLGLLTPDDYTALDYPKGNPSVRPNVLCHLGCMISGFTDRHVTVYVMAPSYPEKFVSASSTKDAKWDIHDTGVHTN